MLVASYDYFASVNKGALDSPVGKTAHGGITTEPKFYDLNIGGCRAWTRPRSSTPYNQRNAYVYIQLTAATDVGSTRPPMPPPPRAKCCPEHTAYVPYQRSYKNARAARGSKEAKCPIGNTPVGAKGTVGDVRRSWSRDM